MTVFHPGTVIDQAERQGWTCTSYDAGQGQLVFLERWMRGDKFMLHVWCTTGTVGSYLDHPSQGKQQLYRRNVDESMLRQILNNPRVHTGQGYHERSELDRRQPQQEARTRTVACPGCGKMHFTMGDTAQHFESGRCPSCPGQDNARRAAYGFVRQQEQRAGTAGAFTNGQQMLTYNGSGQVDHTAGYESGAYNYSCPGCGKQFRSMSALLNHQQAKPQCRGVTHLALGFTTF